MHKPPRDRGFLSLGTHTHSHLYSRDSFVRSLFNHYPNVNSHTRTLDRVYPRGGDCSTTTVGTTCGSLSLNLTHSHTLRSYIPRSRAHHYTPFYSLGGRALLLCTLLDCGCPWLLRASSSSLSPESLSLSLSLSLSAAALSQLMTSLLCDDGEAGL